MECQTIGCVCAHLVDNQKGAMSLFAPDACTTDLQNVACSGCSSRLECEVLSMSAGLFFLHTSTKTRVAAVSAREYQSSIPGGFWEMANTVYCLEEAPVDFDEHFGKVSEDLCDEFGSLCLTRLDVRAFCISIKAHGRHDVQTHGRRCVGWSR